MSKKPRHEELKQFLEILGKFDKAGDIYSYLAKPENLKVVEALDKTLKAFEELASDYQDLRFRYDLFKDFVIKMEQVLKGDYSFLQQPVEIMERDEID